MYYIHIDASLSRIKREDDERTRSAWLNAWLGRVDKMPKLADLLSDDMGPRVFDAEEDPEAFLAKLDSMTDGLPEVRPVGWNPDNE